MTNEQIQDIAKEMGIDATAVVDRGWCTLGFYNPKLGTKRYIDFRSSGFGIYPGDSERIVRLACEKALKDME